MVANNRIYAIVDFLYIGGGQKPVNLI